MSSKKKVVRVEEYSPLQVFGRKIQRLIVWASGLIQGVILLQVLLVMLNANQNNTIVSFIYRINDILLAPFRNLVSDVIIGGIVVDLTALIAIIVYSFATWLLSGLVQIIFSSETRKKKEVIYDELSENNA